MASRIEQIAWGCVVAGVALWLAAPAFMDLGYDANTYVATGHGWMREGELLLAWGDVLTWGPSPPGHSHHFPPAYPLFLGVVFTLFGYGLAQAKLAAVAAALGALGVAYWTTRDLYGARAAAVVAGLVALNPHLLWVTGMGFSEGLSLMLFTLTMWAIVKSLREERYIVLAGVFAGLAYLARASMGAFFLVAGGAGFAWRLAHRGPRGVASPWYGVAIGAFGAIVGLWAYRNVDLFGWPNWETSPGTRGIPRWIWEHRPEFLSGVALRTPLMLAVFAPLVALLAPEARRSLRRLRDERVSALWLAVFLVTLLGIVFSAAYFSMGPSRYEALRLDNMRYVLVAIVPLLWALVSAARLDDPRFVRRLGALALVLLVGCAAVFAYPAQYLPSQAARALAPHLQEGDTIVVSGAGKYPFYAYLDDPLAVQVYVDGNGPPDARPEFVLSLWPQARDGYVVLLERTQSHPFWLAEDDYVSVLGRADVVASRGIALDAPRAGW